MRNLQSKINTETLLFPSSLTSVLSPLEFTENFTPSLRASNLLFWTSFLLLRCEVSSFFSLNDFLRCFNGQNKSFFYSIITGFPPLPKVLFSLEVPKSFHSIFTFLSTLLLGKYHSFRSLNSAERPGFIQGVAISSVFSRLKVLQY